jgi:Tol biopolymer transport system component
MLANLAFAKDDIAYLRLTDNFWQVWVTDATGSSHRQITFDPIDKARVSWSADRQKLLCNQNDGRALFVDINGGKKEFLPLDALGVFDVQLSADGKHIAYSATTSLQADNAEIWLADANGRNQRKLTDHIAVALTPAWNVKTGAILYSAGKPGANQEIWSVDPRTGDSEQITISKSSAVDPSVNVKGEMLFSSDMQGNYSIWLLDNSKKMKRITQLDAFDAQPSWSPSENKFAFYRLDGKKRRIWVHDLNSGKELPITPESVASRYPAWIR